MNRRLLTRAEQRLESSTLKQLPSAKHLSSRLGGRLSFGVLPVGGLHDDLLFAAVGHLHANLELQHLKPRLLIVPMEDPASEGFICRTDDSIGP